MGVTPEDTEALTLDRLRAILSLSLKGRGMLGCGVTARHSPRAAALTLDRLWAILSLSLKGRGMFLAKNHLSPSALSAAPR